VVIKPTKNQMEDLRVEIAARASAKERVLVTTLTKRMAEDLAAYLTGKGLRVRYLHSDIDALERIQIIKDLRQGKFDALVGINLLREGLDIPEVSLVAILDADKEGFLRSETALIQVCGRAARNVKGKVILYADTMTGSMKRALGEMNRRREKQIQYNQTHGITPTTIVKAIQELEEFESSARREELKALYRAEQLRAVKPGNVPTLLKEIERQMREAADQLDFETAAVLRDQMLELHEMTGKNGKKADT